MPHRRRERAKVGVAALLLLLLGTALSLSACRSSDDGLLVFAAASLSDVLEPVGEVFTQETGVPVRFSFGGSYTLAQQQLRGAPGDLFIAAGITPMETLAHGDLLRPASMATVLTNELVLVVPSDGAGVSSLQELLSDRIPRLTMANPQLAPAGGYAQAALERLGLWEGVQEKLVLAPDVRTALAYVERGDADAGLVYRTDAAGRRGLRVLTLFPPGSHPPIVYPGAVLREASRPQAAAAFLAFLQTERARAIFRRHGWSVPEEA